jgi:competence CoiA-like predicted nuclease
MRYANNDLGDKIEPQNSGQRAICPGCKFEVTGKNYQNKNNHWAHLNSDYDKWYEPTSE